MSPVSYLYICIYFLLSVYIYIYSFVAGQLVLVHLVVVVVHLVVVHLTTFTAILRPGFGLGSSNGF